VGVTPPVQSVLNGGGQANYTVTTTALNGFTGAVTLSCVTPLPTGITCGFGPTNTTTLSLTPTLAGTNTNLRLTVAGTTPVNQYSVMVKAASGTTLTPMTQVAINVGVPSITNISPSTGAWGQTVTITGAAFSATPSKDIVMFNGVQANVSLASPTSLTVQVPAGSSTGNVTVSTFATSNAVPFTVQNLPPTVTTVTPNVLTVGAPATMITLSGTNFVPGPDPLPGSQVQLDGANISTSFVSPTQITATVTQAQAASAHVYSLTVVNPAPGGGTSSASNFVITAVDPVTSTVVAAPSANVLANNSATSTITVTVKNSGSAGISGQTVQLSASGNGNTISPVSAVTNGSGVATLTLKSTKAELKTISATVTLNPGGNQMSLNAQPTVGFVADASTVSSSLSGFFVAPAIARADGAATSNLQATIVDAFGNPLAGQNVAFSSSGSGNTISLPAVTDANGVATGTISSTTPEVKVLTATVNPGAGQVVLATHPTVAFVPYPRFAFVTNKSDGTVSQFTVNSSTGQLRHNGYSMVGSLPVALVSDPANKFLFVANSGSANISAFTIGADGWLNPASGSVSPAGTTPSALAVDPTGKFLYAANSGSANVSVFKISAVTGALTPVSQPSAGTGPSALTVDRTGKYLYVANNGGGNVSGFSINATTGDLTSLGSPFAAGSGPVAIAADPSGRFALVVNNTSATVSSYTVDSVTGALTNTGSIPAGAGADAIAIDPSGSFAYVANATGNSVSSYQIAPSDGHLTSLGTIPAGTGPSTVTVDPSGSFVGCREQRVERRLYL
jgi:3-carboxymuconate cyclase